MKKLTVLFLFAIMMLSLSACVGSGRQTTSGWFCRTAGKCRAAGRTDKH